MSNQRRLIWYCLLNASDGQPYKGSSADKVSVSIAADVTDFRSAVLATNIAILTGFVSSQEAFDKRDASDDTKQELLEEDALINYQGQSTNDALIVLVPTPVMSKNGHKSINISESIYQSLTQPFDREPTLTELVAFLSSEPLV